MKVLIQDLEARPPQSIFTQGNFASAGLFFLNRYQILVEFIWSGFKTDEVIIN